MRKPQHAAPPDSRPHLEFARPRAGLARQVSSNAIRHRYQSGRAGYGGTALIPEFIGFMPRILLRDYDIVSWDPKRACGLVVTAFS